jgi:hypothetical protein
VSSFGSYLSAGGGAAGVPVTEWQPPAEDPPADDSPASDPVENPDVAPSSERPAEDLAPAATPPKMSTKIQQKRIAQLLNDQGVTDNGDKLLVLGEKFKRVFGSSAELTFDEALELIEFLLGDAPANQAPAETEGGDQ